jgi:outer membrane lipoprotein-sorting protein
MVKLRAVLVSIALALAYATFAQAQVDPFEHPTSGSALLNTTLAAPAKTLANAKVLKGRFVHQKHLSEVPQPLTANGEFTYARELGVYWHTIAPFDSVFILTQRGIVQRDEGAETMRLSAQEQPAVRVIADIFLALFTLDVSSLSASFDLYGKSQGERWIVGLRPKSATIGSVFKQATITGAKVVEQVVLVDAHGDRTVIDLKDIQYSAEPPSADLQALFRR